MKKTINIEGMSCMNCVHHVTEALTNLGLSDVNVDLDAKKATVEAGCCTKDEDIKKAIEDAGYEVVGIE